MRKIIFVTSFVIIILILSYLRWFDFSYSFEKDNLIIKLPDFVDSRYLKKEGFKLIGDDLLEWKKKGKFNWLINDRSFIDTFEVRLDPNSNAPNFIYPYIGAYKIIMTCEVDKRFQSFLNKEPDSTRSELLNDFEGYYEFYELDRDHNMIRERFKFSDKEQKRIIYIIYPKNKLNIFHNIYMFIKRLLFIGSD